MSEFMIRKIKSDEQNDAISLLVTEELRLHNLGPELKKFAHFMS